MYVNRKKNYNAINSNVLNMLHFCQKRQKLKAKQQDARKETSG